MLNPRRSFLDKLVTEFLATLEWLVIILPNTNIGTRLRLCFWKRRLKNPYIKYVGRNAEITMTAPMDLGRSFTLGDFAALAIGDSDPIYIGNDVGMGRGAYLRSANHRFDDVDVAISAQGHTSKRIEFQGKIYSIVIEDDVWIGANAIILTGAHIGKGTIVSAASVVSSQIPPYSIIVGNPARVIANRLNLAKLKAEERE